jgi:hypothetical protein
VLVAHDSWYFYEWADDPADVDCFAEWRGRDWHLLKIRLPVSSED